MDKKAAISKLLKISQWHANGGLGIGGTPSTMSQPQSLQPQLNEAVHAYVQRGELEQLSGIIAMMQTTNALSETEADEILTALEAGE